MGVGRGFKPSQEAEGAVAGRKGEAGRQHKRVLRKGREGQRRVGTGDNFTGQQARRHHVQPLLWFHLVEPGPPECRLNNA